MARLSQGLGYHAWDEDDVERMLFFPSPFTKKRESLLSNALSSPLPLCESRDMRHNEFTNLPFTIFDSLTELADLWVDIYDHARQWNNHHCQAIRLLLEVSVLAIWTRHRDIFLLSQKTAWGKREKESWKCSIYLSVDSTCFFPSWLMTSPW